MGRLLELGSAVAMIAFLANSGPAHGDAVCFIGKSATINYTRNCINALDDINSQGDDGWGTLLHAAVLNARPEIVRFLIDSGVSVLAWTKQHNDLAIHKAAGRGRADIIRLLIEAGSPWDLPGGPNNQTPLHRAALAKTPKAIEAMMVLLNAGANPDMKDDNGMTALDYTKRNPYVFDAEGYGSLVERLR